VQADPDEAAMPFLIEKQQDALSLDIFERDNSPCWASDFRIAGDEAAAIRWMSPFSSRSAIRRTGRILI